MSSSSSSSRLVEDAIDLDIPVFPCDSLKRPLTENGFQDATRDEETIRDWFSNPNAKMIGVPTGHASGIIAIDIDMHGQINGMPWLEENRLSLPPTRMHSTMSGGIHILFRMPKDIEIRNSASRLAKGVDVRGEGGYIIFPPSPGYSISAFDDIAEMPAWLKKACAPPERPLEGIPAVARPVSETREQRYAITALDGEIAAVIRAAEGTRNVTLNNAAVKLGSLVARGSLTQALVVSELTRAARGAGLDPVETERTINSGLRKGMEAPRNIKDRPFEGKPNYTDMRNPWDEQSAAEADESVDDAFPFINFMDIKPNYDVHEVVAGLLIEQSLAVVYGESNSGKTFFCADMALHIAAGMEWRGRVTKKGLVIFVSLEGSNGFAARVEAFRKEHDIAEDIPFVGVTAAMNMRNERDVDKLMKTIGKAEAAYGMKASVVFIDTLSRAMAGGNENDSTDMGAVVAAGDKIRMTKGCTVIFVHHTGKDNTKGARGHSLLRAALDTEIEVQKAEFSTVRSARVSKQRDLESGAIFDFQLVVVPIGQNHRGEEVTSCVVEHIDGGGHRVERLNGVQRHSLQILSNVCLAKGSVGFPDVPHGAFSVQAGSWRDAFQDNAMPGATAEEKNKVFRRASDALIQLGRVGMANGRVWVAASRQRYERMEGPGGE